MDDFRGGRYSLPISHLLFADDTLVLLQGSKRSIQKMFMFINMYETDHVIGERRLIRKKVMHSHLKRLLQLGFRSFRTLLVFL